MFKEVALRHYRAFRLGRRLAAATNPGLEILPENTFLHLLRVERGRAERSGRRFLLLLLELGPVNGTQERTTRRLATAMIQTVRSTDIIGWFKDNAIIGAIFTEIGATDEKAAEIAISGKVRDAVFGVLGRPEGEQVRLSVYALPERWEDDSPNGGDGSTRIAPPPPLAYGQPNGARLKRVMDAVGSAAAILLLSPLLSAIAVAVRLTSDGPVFFRQVRLGWKGRPFTFLKFRSMYVNSDQRIHEEYVSRFISGGASAGAATQEGRTLYKIMADPRVTPLGRFLRRTSLDELPQLFNVLKGDMSLVGPRPPVAYEFARYCAWHRRRLAAVKPGITGLWQVEGRSRVKFDDMVRLDLRYAMSRSLWLDLKILARTPGAVLTGEGAC